jgi:hypothetical protein
VNVPSYSHAHPAGLFPASILPEAAAKQRHLKDSLYSVAQIQFQPRYQQGLCADASGLAERTDEIHFQLGEAQPNAKIN